MTISIIEQENTQMINDLYRLLKKYSGLRNLIRELKVCILYIQKNYINMCSKLLYITTNHKHAQI